MPVALGIANSPVFLNLVVGGGVTPPDAPTNLVATLNGSDIDLTWIDNSTDEDGFKIYRSSDNIIFVEIDDIAAGSTSYTDLNPGAGIWYYYVAAYNAGGESDSNVASVFIGALDSVPNMVHIYDIARRWVSSYNGDLVRLRRDSDNAESDFTYVANGDLDTAAINTWLGGANGFIVRIYDQISGDDVSQATAGSQPLYVASGQGGRPVGRYNGTSHHLFLSAFTSAITQPFNVYATAILDATAVNDNLNHWLFNRNSASVFAGLFTASGPTPDVWAVNAGSSINSPNATASAWYVWSVLLNGVSSQYWKNGTSEASGNAGANGMTGISIGAPVAANASGHWKGDIATVAIADPPNTTPDRETAQNALGDYYGIVIA